MSIKEFLRSQTFKGVIIGLVAATVVMASFQVGVSIGERKAKFSHRFGDSFERNFRGPDGWGMRGPDEDFMPGGHGAVGEIVSLALPTIVVSGPDKLEMTIVLDEETVVRRFREEIQAADLKVGDHIVTLGEPDEEGRILAKLIRVLPPPPDFDKAE